MTTPPTRPVFVLAVWDADHDRFHTTTAHDPATVAFYIETAPQGVPVFAFEVAAESLSKVAAVGVGGRRRSDLDQVQALASHARWCAAIHAGLSIEAIDRAVWGDVAAAVGGENREAA